METRFDLLENIDCPKYTQLAPLYRKSEAYYWLKDELPMLINNLIVTLEMDREEIMTQYGVDARNDIKRVIARLQKIKYEIQHDKRFLVFEHEEPDRRRWNRYIEKLPEQNRRFFGATWLDVECYLYRKIASFFANTYNLQDFDYFAKVKQMKLLEAKPVFSTLLEQLEELTPGHESLFYLFQLNLWHLQIEKFFQKVPFELVDSDFIKEKIASILERKEYLLVNDIEKVWDCLILGKLSGKSELVVHIILGESGFQLFVNFLIATYLIDKQLATCVVFHPKFVPFRISEATYQDIDWFLKEMQNTENEVLLAYVSLWLEYLNEGKFQIQKNEYFWTMPHPFYKMKEKDSNIFETFRRSQLLIFCGDMNYRKLIGDFRWDVADQFLTALRGFVPTNLVAIRSIGSPALCGCKRDQCWEIFKKSPQWLNSHEYGLIQFCNSEPCSCSSPGDYLPDDVYFDIFSSLSETCSQKLARIRLRDEEEEAEMEFEGGEAEEASTSSEISSSCCYAGTPKKRRYRYRWICRRVQLPLRDLAGFKKCRTLDDLRLF